MFFRTTTLLLVGAIPIFILEGEAPQLKQSTMDKRLNGNNNNKAPTKNNIVRKRLNSLQKQVGFISDLDLRKIISNSVHGILFYNLQIPVTFSDTPN